MVTVALQNNLTTMLWTLLTVASYTLGALLVAVMALWWWIRPFKVSPNVPGPKRHWLLGITFEDNETFLSDKDKETFDWGHWPTLSLVVSRRFNFRTWGGPTINIGFGGATFNVVSPAELQYILSTNMNNYVKGKLAKSFFEIIGKTAFTTDGDEWRFHRKITVNILNREAVTYTSRIMNQKLQRLETYLKTEKEGQVIDFQEVSYKLILDVLFHWAFGLNVNQFEDDGDNQTISKVIEAFDDLQLYTHQRFNDFFWEIKQRWCIGEREKKIKECSEIMDDFCLDLIQQTREQQKLQDAGTQTQSTREDVISRYLRYTEKEDVNCTNQMLRDFCMQFLLAGRDSTAAALSWCLYELTRHPTWTLALREEVDELCGNADHNADKFTMDAIQRLKVVNAVVNESLRLHSPAPDNYRFAVKDDVLPDGTPIPAGALVMFSPYTINHSDKVWGPTADEFDPSRWMDMGEPSPSRFPTFGLGGRMCPGRNLGLMEVKMALAFLVSKFDFVDEQGHDGDYVWRLVMSMKDGFPVRVSARKV